MLYPGEKRDATYHSTLFDVRLKIRISTITSFLPTVPHLSSVSLSAHAHPFGIGGWASTYLSVCGLLAGAFTVLVRLREEKSTTTRGYGNASCVISWLCAISVVYGRYGVAGVGVVGTTSVAGVPVSSVCILIPALCLVIFLHSISLPKPSDVSLGYFGLLSDSYLVGR